MATNPAAQVQRFKKRKVGSVEPADKHRLTDTLARNLPAPASGYVIYWDAGTEGFGLRVTANNARAWITQRRDDRGKSIRRTLGRADGAQSISADAARRQMLNVSSELQNGRDRLAERKAERAADKADKRTFGVALREYVLKKRRAKDGLPLKERTRADYLAMIEPAGTTKRGLPTRAGMLWSLIDRPLQRITGDELRRLYAGLAERGERQRTYAMQVVRAVLRHEGVNIVDNPLSPTTAGAKRVTLAPSRGNPTPIPAVRLRDWWRAASAIKTVSADQLRFELLTGCRPGEAATITVGQVDLAAGTVTLHDTKNRRDHVIALSRQARDVVAAQIKKKRAHQAVFGVADAGKTMQAINAAAKVSKAITPHKLRHTFASVAAQHVPEHQLKRMLNHANDGDVTDAHYVYVHIDRLRAAWQLVADHITGAKK